MRRPLPTSMSGIPMRRPLQSPMADILTRSQAEIFVHRSRSGRARPDLAGCKHHQEDPIHSSSSLDDLELLGKPCAEELVKASGEHQPAPDAGSGRLQRNTLKNKRVIAQCSRSELYQDPCSFGYRRLLPYLSDMEKVPSDKKKVPSDKKYSGCEEIIPPSMLINAVPLPALNDGIIESEVKPEQQTCDLDSSNVNKMYELNPSSYVDSMVVGESIECLLGDDVESEEKHVTESSISIPEAAQCLRSKVYRNLNSFGYRRLQPYLQDLEKDIGGEEILDFCVLEVEKKTEELPSVLSVDPCLALNDDHEMLQLCKSSSYPPSSSTDGQSSGPVPKECLPLAPKLRRSGPESHALAPRKSLLKKQTRGCIGICTCLDCSSFRLYAERASEFSRRQMLEADDIVTALMKELASLRKLAEKSASPQVKEFCRDAMKVDQAAKSRMRNLIREMNIHCRHPGPRVKFVDPIEEIRILDSGKE